MSDFLDDNKNWFGDEDDEDRLKKTKPEKKTKEIFVIMPYCPGCLSQNVKVTRTMPENPTKTYRERYCKCKDCGWKFKANQIRPENID